MVAVVGRLRRGTHRGAARQRRNRGHRHSARAAHSARGFSAGNSMTLYPWKELRKLPGPVWLLSAAGFINRMGTMALPFLALYLTRHRDLSIKQAGVVVGCYGAGALAVGPLAGWMCDRFGARRMLALSLFLSGAVVLCFPLVTSFESAIAVTLLWAVTAQVTRPATYSSVA